MPNSNNQNGDSIAGLFVIILFFIAIIFAFSPGMLSMYALHSSLNLDLDGGQMWTFSIIFCLAYLAILYLSFKDWNKSIFYYAIASIGIIGFFLIAGYGFKAEFAENAWNLFF
ncbi:MAG: hypothetical protein P1U56_05895 [Saprospiraceae bacterium]|nr:hypothetical protein [Saprospiraceae bacterium]